MIKIERLAKIIGEFISKFFRNVAIKICQLEKKCLPQIDGEYIFCFQRSRYVNTLTILACLLVIALSLYFIIAVNSVYLMWWVPIFSSILILLGVISSPVAIHIGDRDIEIHGILEVTRIKVSSIEHIYALNPAYARIFLLPVATSLGFLGYNGRFYDIKHKRWIKGVCSEFNNLIMIECIGRKSYLISATNREEIIDIISARVNKKKIELKKIIDKTHNKKKIEPKKVEYNKEIPKSR